MNNEINLCDSKQSLNYIIKEKNTIELDKEKMSEIEEIVNKFNTFILEQKKSENNKF